MSRPAKEGEVWVARLDYIRGVRPVVILEDWAGGYNVCPVTTRAYHKLPFLPVGETGLRSSSFAKINDPLFITDERLRQRLGVVDEGTFQELCFACPEPLTWL